jgi:hypothetical protein
MPGAGAATVEYPAGTCFVDCERRASRRRHINREISRPDADPTHKDRLHALETFGLVARKPANVIFEMPLSRGTGVKNDTMD